MGKTVFKAMLVLCLASLAGYAALYSFLPPFVPIHWGINGGIDGWARKSSSIFLALMPLGMLAVMAALPKIDPKSENYQWHKKAYSIITVAIVLMFTGIKWAMLGAAMGLAVNMKLVLMLVLGLGLLILGNYMPQIKHNFFIGVRTPWTIADPLVWQKTNRIGGLLFCVGGILVMLGGFIDNWIYHQLVFLGMLAAIAGLFLYSYLIFRKLKHTRGDKDVKD